MNSIIITIILLGILGLLAGILLSVVSIVMAVKKDEKAEQLESILPGANCGGCGYSGCAGYATALSNGETTNTNLCTPGGPQTAEKIAEIIGVEQDEFIPKTAVVRCRGSWDVVQMQMEYRGIQTCSAANQLFMGLGACHYGCIGFGDCAISCEQNAITVNNGVAKIDFDLCIACGKCVKSCPKGIITLVPSAREDRVVLCLNRDKGAQTRASCTVGCIGCMKCVKVCEYDAVTVNNNLAVIDFDKCVGCGKCEEVCPQNCIASFVKGEKNIAVFCKTN